MAVHKYSDHDMVLAITQLSTPELRESSQVKQYRNIKQNSKRAA